MKDLLSILFFILCIWVFCFWFLYLFEEDFKKEFHKFFKRKTPKDIYEDLVFKDKLELIKKWFYKVFEEGAYDLFIKIWNYNKERITYHYYETSYWIRIEDFYRWDYIFCIDKEYWKYVKISNSRLENKKEVKFYKEIQKQLKKQVKNRELEAIKKEDLEYIKKIEEFYKNKKKTNYELDKDMKEIIKISKRMTEISKEFLNLKKRAEKINWNKFNNINNLIK